MITVIEHGVDYEREKVDEKLKKGTLTLEPTTAWISKAITMPEDIVGCSRLAYLTLHTEAVRSLITSPYKLTRDACPVTLLAMPSVFMIPVTWSLDMRMDGAFT